MLFNGLSLSLNFQYITLKAMVRFLFAEKPLKVLSLTVSISTKLLRLNFFNQCNIISTNTFWFLLCAKHCFGKSVGGNNKKGRQK